MNPNEVQVGGEHYQSEFQHWDLMIAWDTHYLLAAATKYVVRWRKKGGLQDLQKAMHYLDKMIDAVGAGKLRPHYEDRWEYRETRSGATEWSPSSEMLAAWNNFVVSNNMDGLLYSFTLQCISWKTISDLLEAKETLNKYTEQHEPETAT
jgi:hypothetical protein